MMSLGGLQSYIPVVLGGLGRVALTIGIWVGGRRLIELLVTLMGRAMHGRKLDPTIIRYLSSAVGGMLTVALVIVILGQFGVETTSFAALLGGIGLAVGAAWGGLLGRLAAGLFMLALRPFKVGDWISAGGVTGSVSEIGIFGTTINTGENVQTIVGNNKIFGENIQNFTINDYQRISVTVTLDAMTDPEDFIRSACERARTLEHVLSAPGPSGVIAEVSAGNTKVTLTMCSHFRNAFKLKSEFNVMLRNMLLNPRSWHDTLPAVVPGVLATGVGGI